MDFGKAGDKTTAFRQPIHSPSVFSALYPGAVH